VPDGPEPTVGRDVAVARTLRDCIGRAMTFPAPHPLPADDVCALTAYIPDLSGIVAGGFVADRKVVPEVRMRRSA